MLCKFDSLVRILSKWFAYIGALLFLVLLLVTLVDVIGTALFSSPLLGSTELVGLLQALLIALAVAQTQIFRRHISVDFMVARLPKRIQVICYRIVNLLLFGLFAVLVWQLCVLGLSFQSSGEYSITLRLPTHYFVLIMAFAFIVSCLLFLLLFLKSFGKIDRR